MAETDNLPPSPRQTALRSLAGLVLLWACLVLLFKAHTLSDQTAAGKPSPDSASAAEFTPTGL